ncbi:MAG: hypothetical protein ACQES9_08420 [Myxococcota bacterium]
MINKSIFLLILFLFSNCKNNDNSSNTETPHLKNKIKNNRGIEQKKQEEKRKVDQSKENIKFRYLNKDDKLNCHNICLQLGWCNRKLYGQKEGENKKFKICRKLCKHDKSETGKVKKSTFKECVDKYRGNHCKKLKKCLKEKFMAKKKKLHNKGPKPDKPKNRKGE